MKTVLIPLAEAVAQIERQFRAHGTEENQFDMAAIVHAVESHWVLMEDERTDDHEPPNWSCVVHDFDEPSAFLMIELEDDRVTIRVGSAMLSAFDARAIADESERPSEMIERITGAPGGWVASFHVKRSEFELNPVS